ncbi:TIR-NBS-LRR resistance protein, partial [Trifolium medium]|nr:TIR-NBS-LRR resistance protein [Trifolium medium]
MADVREEWGRHGRMHLKKKLYSDLLGEPDLNIDRPHGLPISVEWRLRRMKVLVVLDDVSDEEQLEILIGSRTLDWFGRGSRIIITTRDKQVLAKRVDDNDVYKLKPLDFDDSFQLFILTAFGQNHAKMDTECHQFFSYHKYFLQFFLSKMINYTEGIPLVVKELGHFIGGKYRKTWKSECEKLTRVPLKNVHDAIGLSCNDLNRVEKEAWDFALMQMRFDHIRLLLNVDNKQLLCIDIKRHFCFPTNQLFRFDRNYSLFAALIEHGMSVFDDMHKPKRCSKRVIGFGNQTSYVESFLSTDSEDAPGIGKTTIVEGVYTRICSFNMSYSFDLSIEQRLSVFDDMHKHKPNLKRGLIGFGNQISHVESLLMSDSKDVRAIGIWGMAGMGKTTIVMEVYRRLYSEYDSCCFMANVREEWRIHGRMFLKKELYSILLRKENLNIERPHGLPYFVERRLRRMKVLVVLDDVSDEE